MSRISSVKRVRKRRGTGRRKRFLPIRRPCGSAFGSLRPCGARGGAAHRSARPPTARSHIRGAPRVEATRAAVRPPSTPGAPRPIHQPSRLLSRPPSRPPDRRCQPGWPRCRSAALPPPPPQLHRPSAPRDLALASPLASPPTPVLEYLYSQAQTRTRPRRPLLDLRPGTATGQKLHSSPVLPHPATATWGAGRLPPGPC